MTRRRRAAAFIAIAPKGFASGRRAKEGRGTRGERDPPTPWLRRDKSVIRRGESALPTAGLVIRDQSSKRERRAETKLRRALLASYLSRLASRLLIHQCSCCTSGVLCRPAVCGDRICRK